MARLQKSLRIMKSTPVSYEQQVQRECQLVVVATHVSEKTLVSPRCTATRHLYSKSRFTNFIEALADASGIDL